MNYTLLLKNNLDKTVHQLNVTDTDTSSIYYVFKDVQIDLTNGEYTYWLVPNDGQKEIVINPNDIEKSTIDGNAIEVAVKGLCQVGEYINRSTKSQYEGNKEYKQYRG